MLKKSMISLFITMFIFTPFAMAIAEEGPGGNKRKGKYTYRKVYKACPDTPVVSPADKKKAEWADIFENRKFDEFGCVDQWTAMADKDILDIYTYFYSFAADSPSPATCR
ncbi:MAG: cytochrome c family protein [Desulfobacterales bacterium]|nr:cytochrome c family protein [Desulfobacterales bacterium]